jgi:lipid II isoglutaminyl synthase (glutamine-hydrolysing)
LGTVLVGEGNNGTDKTEGAIYKNAFGCYLHGSLLPKNPHFADYLIAKALERKKLPIKLIPLDDSVEWEAHAQATLRTRLSN